MSGCSKSVQYVHRPSHLLAACKHKHARLTGFADPHYTTRCNCVRDQTLLNPLFTQITWQMWPERRRRKKSVLQPCCYYHTRSQKWLKKNAFHALSLKQASLNIMVKYSLSLALSLLSHSVESFESFLSLMVFQGMKQGFVFITASLL